MHRISYFLCGEDLKDLQQYYDQDNNSDVVGESASCVYDGEKKATKENGNWKRVWCC